MTVFGGTALLRLLRTRALLPGALLACASLLPAFPESAQALAESHPAYAAPAGLTGRLNATGSDTLGNLLTLWTEGFRRHHPEVLVGIEARGSSTAPPALIQGTADLGPMSREMTVTEVDDFEERYGYAPTRVPVAVDALAVFVHKDNPLEEISLDALDGIFSATARRGGPLYEGWGDLGLPAPWSHRPISLYGRNSASGTSGFFKDVALGHGDYRDSVKEQPGSASVVQGVAADPFGIGYSGIGYRTAGVKPLAIAPAGGEPAILPTFENTLSGTYPLGRFLSLYVNKRPGEPLDAVTRAFLAYILSREGQRDVLRAGYFPLPVSVATAVRADLLDAAALAGEETPAKALSAE